MNNSSSSFGASKLGTIIVVKTAMEIYIIHLFHFSEVFIILSIAAEQNRAKNVKTAISITNPVISVSKI
jgi:hypothetical protein